MTKKILALAGAGAMVLALVVPVLAEVKIKNENVDVRTKVYTKADTGDNSIGGKYVSGGKIRTGDALAYSEVASIVNFSLVGTE